MPGQAWTATDCSGRAMTDGAVIKLPRLFGDDRQRPAKRVTDGRGLAECGMGLPERSLNYSGFFINQNERKSNEKTRNKNRRHTPNVITQRTDGRSIESVQ